MPQWPPAHPARAGAVFAFLMWPCLAVLSAGAAAGATVSGAPAWVLQHLNPRTTQAWRPLPLSVVNSGDHVIARVEVRYRTAGEADYAVLPMRELSGAWGATVPASAVVPPGLEYYIRIVDRAGVAVTRPVTDAIRAPFQIAVVPEADSTISVLSPAADEVAEISTPQIAAFFDPPLPPHAVLHVWLDGEVVAADGDSARDYVSFVPPAPLAAGEHVARIEILGGPAPRVRAWSFRIAGGDGEDAATGFSTSGRLALGTELASGGSYENTVLSSLPQPPGSFFAGQGDISALLGSESVTGWFSSTPSTRPRTQGSLLLAGTGHEAEGGTLLLWESELALAGPQASGARATARHHSGEARVFALHIAADEVANRAISGGAATLLARLAPGTEVAVLGSYAEESTSDVVDFAFGDARRGWSVTPRLSAARAGWQGLAEWSTAGWETRPGAARDTTGAAHALLLSAVRSRGPLRASVRFADTAAGYHALLAPFTQEDRREGSATAMLTERGWSLTAGYFLARFALGQPDSLDGWSHRTDASVSRVDSRGQGATLAAGMQDRSWFTTLGGVLVHGGVRATASLTRTHIADITSWAGSGALHAILGPRVTADLILTASTTLQSTSEPPGTLTLSRSILPRAQATWRVTARDGVEGVLSSSSYSTSLYANDGAGARTLHTYHQTVGRLSYVRTW